MPHVVGLDISLTSTGVVIIDHELAHRATSITSASRGSSIPERNGRALSIVDRIFRFLGDIEPVAICIEDYAFSRNDAGGRYIAELGGILRADICDVWPNASNGATFEVAASTLKKFATDKGNCDKIAIVTACLERWNFGPGSSDEADAYCLARMAAIYAGFCAPETKKQAEAVTKATGKRFTAVAAAGRPARPANPLLPF